VQRKGWIQVASRSVRECQNAAAEQEFTPVSQGRTTPKRARSRDRANGPTAKLQRFAPRGRRRGFSPSPETLAKPLSALARYLTPTKSSQGTGKLARRWRLCTASIPHNTLQSCLVQWRLRFLYNLCRMHQKPWGRVRRQQRLLRCQSSPRRWNAQHCAHKEEKPSRMDRPKQ